MAQDQIYVEAKTKDLYLSHIRRSVSYSMRHEHAHAEWELYYLVSGERRYFVRDHVVHVQKGDLVLIPAWEIHKSLPVQEAAHERISVEFKDSFLDGLMKDFRDLRLLSVFQGQTVVRLPEAEHGWLRRELFRIVAEGRERAPGWENAVRLMLCNVLLFLERSRMMDVSGVPVPAGQLSWMPNLLRYLAGHYMEEITLAAVASQYFLNPSYLSRAFRKSTGMTFADYLTGIRVREARHLLETTSFPVSEIAERCGFEGSTQFGRVFKRVSGQTPGGYRKEKKSSV